MIIGVIALIVVGIIIEMGIEIIHHSIRVMVVGDGLQEIIGAIGTITEIAILIQEIPFIDVIVLIVVEIITIVIIIVLTTPGLTVVHLQDIIIWDRMNLDVPSVINNHANTVMVPVVNLDHHHKSQCQQIV